MTENLMNVVITKPHRVQLSRSQGWRLPRNTIVVSRPTCWGNPYVATTAQERLDAVEHYRAWLYGPAGDAFRQQAVACLRGHNLACWCALDGPCHADILLEVSNQD